ncbi:MAG: hypothetical protein AB8B79_12445 [Granulosicoccus sp.]
MARSLTFTHSNKLFDAQLHKLDRSRLYGSVRILTENSEGQRCTVATLGSDGKTLIPRGGTALGYVNTVGEWISRDELQPVSLKGDPVAEVESSFDAPIVLDAQASATEFLDHSVRLTYRLGLDETAPKSFLKELAKGVIYRFGFSYRGGVGYDPTFILSDADANVWMMVTTVNDVQFVSLEQASICAGEHIADEVGNEDDDGTIDFGML